MKIMKKTTITIDNDLWMTLAHLQLEMGEGRKYTYSQVIRRLLEIAQKIETADKFQEKRQK